MQVINVINKKMNGVKVYVYFFGFGREISTLKVYFSKISKIIWST